MLLKHSMRGACANDSFAGQCCVNQLLVCRCGSESPTAHKSQLKVNSWSHHLYIFSKEITQPTDAITTSSHPHRSWAHLPLLHTRPLGRHLPGLEVNRNQKCWHATFGLLLVSGDNNRARAPFPHSTSDALTPTDTYPPLHQKVTTVGYLHFCSMLRLINYGSLLCDI